MSFILLFIYLNYLRMKTISLRGLKEVLSDGELKNVLGGSGGSNCDESIFCKTVKDCPSDCRGCKDMSNWPGKTCTFAS
jgi:hypothetical protein